MKRLAIFTEGYTEILFLERIIECVAGKNNVVIDEQRISGGGRAPRRVNWIHAQKPVSNELYYVLLVDCGNDRLVKERIREEHAGLTAKGYSQVIGIRDVRPDFTRADIQKLEAGLRKYIKTSLAPVLFVLSVMEIEAWFLAEHTHFARIDDSITIPGIQATFGFNPEADDMSLRSDPADDLQRIYELAGKSYAKGDPNGTVSALDYESVYLEMPAKVTQLAALVQALDNFLS